MRRIGTAFLAALLTLTVFTTTNVGAATGASSLATGESHACAVVNGAAKCWGANSKGQLGNNDSNWKGETRPVDVVSKAAWVETVPKSQDCFAMWCKDVPEKKVSHAAIGLGGRTVTKVSAGSEHTCAIADAQVYCWGSNSDGQLGNGKAGLTQEKVPVAVKTDSESSLKSKEIIDVSAGDNFTCALASDGVVACWGKGTNGRLGNNSNSDKKAPTAVYTGAGSALVGKKAYKLAKASGATMCALVIASGRTNVDGGGSPVCWGYGIDDGTGLPGNDFDDVDCGKSSPTGSPKNTSETVIFSNARPTAITGGQLLTAADGNEYVTGLGANGQAFYWGMYGYRKDTMYANIDSCSVDCKGKVTIQQGNPNNRNDMVSSLSSIILAGMKRVSPGTGDRGANGEYRHDSCDKTTHFGFTKTVNSTYVGQRVATSPAATSHTSGVSIVSGSVYGGLYCAVKSNGNPACDANGTDMTNGRTGSGYTKQCTKSGWTTTCVPTPTGPQPLVSSGWLSGKSITQLSTGSTGYTCAIASGSVGCWGENSNGQLGVGDTTNRNVPTGVGL